MQLKLKRSQQQGGAIFKHTVYCVDVLGEFTPEEQAAIKAQKLGNTVLIHEEQDAGFTDLETGAMFGRDKRILHISVGEITKGHQVQHKDLATLAGFEAELKAACGSLQNRLKAAGSYDGGEEVVDFGDAS